MRPDLKCSRRSASFADVESTNWSQEKLNLVVWKCTSFGSLFEQQKKTTNGAMESLRPSELRTVILAFYTFVFTPDQAPQVRKIYAWKRFVGIMFLAFSTPAFNAFQIWSQIRNLLIFETTILIFGWVWCLVWYMTFSKRNRVSLDSLPTTTTSCYCYYWKPTSESYCELQI